MLPSSGASAEDLFRALIENSSDAVALLDDHARILYASPSSSRILGYDPESRLGKSACELLHCDDLEPAHAAFAAVLAHPGVPIRVEYRVHHHDGSWRTMEAIVVNRLADRSIHGIVVNFRDVTERHRAEEQVRRSEARYRRMIEGAAYGIYRTTAEGRILDANQALAQMLGFESVDALMRHNMSELYGDPGDRPRLIARHAREGRAMGAVEINWRRRDGTPIVVRLTVRDVDFGADGGLCFEGMVEDVTTRRALEEALRQAQKMEAVGRLARGIAHDFNNVLAAILGSSDLLAAQLPADHPARADAEEIRRAAERGAALTRQLLAFSRPQRQEAQAANLHVAGRGIEPMLRRLAGDTIVLRLATPGAPPIVAVEAGQVGQVLLNLVVNARDAMPSGGTVDITIEQVDLDRHDAARFPGLAPGRYARIAVADTGVGIDPATRNHLFEPFFTTKDAGKGTGLGLSIVYGIATEAGGAVAFASEPGRGATFEVVLPIAAGDQR